MLRMKAKKNGMNAVKDSIIFGSGMLAERLSHGVKKAGHRMEYMSEYMNKNPGLNIMRNRVQKNPGGSVLALAGLGLITLGIISLFRK